MWPTEKIWEIRFWWDAITDAKISTKEILQISAGWMATGRKEKSSQLLLPES